MIEFWFDKIACHAWLPEGQSGNWSVRRRFVEGSREVWKQMGMDENGDYSPPGTYTELYEGETRRMSDDVFLLRRDRNFCESARGRILLTGLGLGITARWLALREQVDQVDVVEISQDVINLVGPHLPDKVTIFHADAFTFKPMGSYDAILHDCFEEQPINVDQLMANYQHCAAWQGVSTHVD